MSRGYWVKGYLYKNTDKTAYQEQPVIHRFDTQKEAEFFRSQIHDGKILDWGDGKELNSSK